MLVPESDDSPVEVPEVESFVVEPEELEPELVPESVLEESEPSVDDEPPSVVPVLESVPDVLSEVLPEVLSLPLVVG